MILILFLSIPFVFALVVLLLNYIGYRYVLPSIVKANVKAAKDALEERNSK